MSDVAYDILLTGSNLKLKGGFLGLSSVVLVTAGATRILIDTGHHVTRPLLRAALDARGLAPGDIDLVFLSHLHFDHVGNVDLFAHAPLMVSRRELAYAAAPHSDDDFVPAWILAQLERFDLQAFDGEPEIAPGVQVVATPGHTPGHCSVMLETAARGPVALACDAIKYPKETLTRSCDLAYDTEASGTASIARLMADAERIVPGHFAELRRLDAGRFVWDDGVAFDLIVR